MKAEDNPCYQCPNRKLKCHSTCKEHKDYLDEYHKEQKIIEAARKKDINFNIYSHHKIKRLKGINHEQ